MVGLMMYTYSDFLNNLIAVLCTINWLWCSVQVDDASQGSQRMDFYFIILRQMVGLLEQSHHFLNETTVYDFINFQVLFHQTRVNWNCWSCKKTKIRIEIWYRWLTQCGNGQKTSSDTAAPSLQSTKWANETPSSQQCGAFSPYHGRTIIRAIANDCIQLSASWLIALQISPNYNQSMCYWHSYRAHAQSAKLRNLSPDVLNIGLRLRGLWDLFLCA